jgi:hypothetical protein
VASTPTTGGGVRTVPIECWCCVAVAVVMAIERPPARRDLPAWEWEVTSLSLSLLHSVRGVRGSSHGVYVHHVGEAGTPRTTKSPLPSVPNIKVVL